MTRRNTRIAGSGVLLLAMAVGAEASGFRVAFPTDPLGPAAFPLLAAFLLALGGVALLTEGGWGSVDADPDPDPDAEASDAGSSKKRVSLAALAFLGYSVMLPVLGFVTATTCAFAALAVLFGGAPLRGAVWGLAFSVMLFGLFVWVLGLPLPVWPWPWGA